jgi:hypothetical protein
MSKENFILHELFNEPLTKEQFEIAKLQFFKLLKENKYAIKNADTIYELIDNIKRTPEKVGPYQNISVFEALNRIGSDLVLLSGAAKLFNNETDFLVNKIHLKMGNTKGFDFEVTLNDGKIIYGEAFNAAESFCKHKMRQAIDKLIDKNPDDKAKDAIVFINQEVQNFMENYKNKKELESQIKIHKVFCGKIK